MPQNWSISGHKLQENDIHSWFLCQKAAKRIFRLFKREKEIQIVQIFEFLWTGAMNWANKSRKIKTKWFESLSRLQTHKSRVLNIIKTRASCLDRLMELQISTNKENVFALLFISDGNVFIIIYNNDKACLLKR